MIKEAIRPASRQHGGDAGSFVIYSGERVAEAGKGEVCERSEEAWGEIVLVNLVKACVCSFIPPRPAELHAFHNPFTFSNIC